MTEVKVIEGADGLNYDWTLKQRGNTSGEDLSSFSTVVMYVLSSNLATLHDTITLTIQDSSNGVVRYSPDPTDTLPTVNAEDEELRLKAQIKLTASGVLDSTEIFDFVLVNDLAS